MTLWCCKGGRCLPWTRCCRGELDSLAENTELLSAGTAEKPKQSKGRRIAQPLDTEGEPDKNVSTLSSTVQSVPSCSPIYMTKTALFGSLSSFRACSIMAFLFFLFFFPTINLLEWCRPSAHGTTVPFFIQSCRAVHIWTNDKDWIICQV